MKASSEVEVTIKLNMSLREARWLQSAMQNPFNGENPEFEHQEHKVNRLKLFATLKDQTDNHGG